MREWTIPDDGPEVLESIGSTSQPQGTEASLRSQFDEFRARRSQFIGASSSIDESPIDADSARGLFHDAAASAPRFQALNRKGSLNDQVLSEHESMYDRLKRLQWETSQLEADIQAAGPSESISASVLMSHIYALQKELSDRENSLHPQTVSLQQAKNAFDTSLAYTPQSPYSEHSQLAFKPAQNDPALVDKLAQLESKVTKMEMLLGSSEAQASFLEHGAPEPLTTSLDRLSQQIHLLTDKNSLQQTSAHVNSLIENLSTLGELKNTKDDVRLHEQLGEIHSLLPLLEKTHPIIPRLLSRLRSLAAVHMDAAQAQSTMSDLTSALDAAEKRQDLIETALANAQKSLAENKTLMQENIAQLLSRVRQ